MNRSTVSPTTWMDQAACRGDLTGMTMPEGQGRLSEAKITAIERLKRRCLNCPVYEQCLHWALAERDPAVGMIAAGMTPKERDRARPDRARQDRAAMTASHLPGSRHPRGPEHPHSKLTQKQVDAIRASYHRHEVTTLMLAAEFGVSETTVRNILKERTWSTTPVLPTLDREVDGVGELHAVPRD